MLVTVFSYLIPVVGSLTWRLHGAGAEKTKFLKGKHKAVSWVLMALTFAVLYFLKNRDIVDALALFAISLAGIIPRRNIASSRDFPADDKDNLLTEKPFIDFDWLIRLVYMSKEEAHAKGPMQRRIYKAISYSLNKTVVCSPLALGFALFSLSFWPLLGMFAGMLFGPVYFFYYDLGKKLTPLVDGMSPKNQKRFAVLKDGHALAEYAIGFILGVVDAFIFYNLLLGASWYG